MHWTDYLTHNGSDQHTIVGTLKILPDFHSPQLDNRRAVLVYLPPSYARGERRYPVIYMQDGQNLFDNATSFGGQEWQVDETMELLSREGLEAIVVGAHHAGEERIKEYSPFRWHAQEGRGDEYLQFVVETLKPVIDRDFRTCPERARTGILGSSMGGLISLYAFFRHPAVFGFAGSLSPALWYGSGAIYQYVRSVAFAPGKIYLDHGTKENSAKRMNALLLAKGYQPEASLRYVVEEGGDHSEAAWARRLPEALRFLLRE